MQAFPQIMLMNAVFAAALSPIAWLASRLTRWPGVGYAAWIIVLLRLVMPPLFSFPVLLPVVSVDPQVASSTPSPELNKRTPYAAPAVVPDTVAPSVVARLANEARVTSPMPTPSNFDRNTAEYSLWATGYINWNDLDKIQIRPFQAYVQDK